MPAAGPLFRLIVGNRGTAILLGILLGAAVLVPVLNLAVPPASPMHVPTYIVSLLGKYLCYGLLALSVD
ncbi:MAG: urea ABC transporter permease subunit UrtC, partial [Hyphomicrobium sp.]